MGTNFSHILKFLAILFVLYLVTLLISSYLYVRPHHCVDSVNIMTERDANTPITILIWEYEYHWAGWGRPSGADVPWAGYPVIKPEDPKCIFTSNQSLYDVADVVIFESQPFGKRGDPYPPRKICGQKYLSFTMETSVYFPIQKKKSYLSHMDWRMSNDQNSNIPATFVCDWGTGKGVDGFREMPSVPFQDKHFAVFVASNCGRGGADKRTAYVKELMNYIPVDSFGLCLQNQPPDALNRNTAHDRYRAKMDLFKKYKFILAFENNNITDYVSEKLYHSYIAGSLPVYMGAPNVDEWEPGNNTMIRTSKYKSPKDLANYLKLVASDENLYKEYFKWKTEPFKPKFAELYNNCIFLAEHRVCEYVSIERERAKQSDYPKFDTHSLATTGTVIPMFEEYQFDSHFVDIQMISFVLIIISLLLYLILEVFGFKHTIAKCFCNNYTHLRNRLSPFKYKPVSSTAPTSSTSPSASTPQSYTPPNSSSPGTSTPKLRTPPKSLNQSDDNDNVNGNPDNI